MQIIENSATILRILKEEEKKQRLTVLHNRYETSRCRDLNTVLSNSKYTEFNKIMCPFK
jgi:hypothetical protein